MENTSGSAIRRAKDTNTSNGAQTSSHEQTNEEKTKSSSSHDDITDADSLSLWTHPITTLHYFIRELLIDISNLTKNTLRYKKTVWLSVLVIGLFLLLSRVAGPQQNVSRNHNFHKSFP